MRTLSSMQLTPRRDSTRRSMSPHLVLPRVRSAIALAFDLVRPVQRTDPEFGVASWLTGATPGTLLRATRIVPVGLTRLLNPADAWRIEYATSDARDRVLTSTGAVFRSRTPWAGPGPRPTVAFAPSTQGVARRCDPSFSCTVGIGPRLAPLDLIAAYEQPAINLFVAAGADVVLTDYPRDPASEVQLYCDHVSAARSLADAVLAAVDLGVGQNNLGLWGFSQGGGAIAAWLEQPEYTPQLQPLAAVVGAPPVDLVGMLDHVDGALASVVILYALAGLMARDERVAEEIMPRLSPAGAAAVIEGAKVCALGAVLKRPWAHTDSWTRSGQSMAKLLDDLPRTGKLLDESVLGRRRPLSIPIRLWSTRADDLVPYSGVRRLANQWGVPLQTRALPKVLGRTGVNHFGPYFAFLASDAEWLLRRLGR